MLMSLKGQKPLLLMLIMMIMNLCFTTGFKYSKFNLLEWMHNLGRAFDCILNFLIGMAVSGER